MYKRSRFKQIQQISNQSENDDIPEKANCNLGLLLYLLFLFPTDFIHNLFLRPYYLTRNSTNGSAVLLSHISVFVTWPLYCTAIGGISSTWYGRVSYKYTFWYNFDTVLCKLLETGTSDRCLVCIVQPIPRDVNVFIFSEKRSFRCDNDDKKSKTKRSFLKTIVFLKSSFF